jgi:hypothetical protein
LRDGQHPSASLARSVVYVHDPQRLAYPALA